MAFPALLHRDLSLIFLEGLKQLLSTTTAQNHPFSALACHRAFSSALFYSSCTLNHFQTWSNVIQSPVNLLVTTLNFLCLAIQTIWHHCPTHTELHFWSKIVDGLQQAATKWWQNRIYCDQVRQNYDPWFWTTSVRVGSSDIPFVTHARNLGTIISSNTTIDKYVKHICRSAYAELRRISSICHLLTVNATKTVLSASPDATPSGWLGLKHQLTN